jgi:hypothetical protein
MMGTGRMQKLLVAASLSVTVLGVGAVAPAQAAGQVEMPKPPPVNDPIQILCNNTSIVFLCALAKAI